jgi:hypothetical protein
MHFANLHFLMLGLLKVEYICSLSAYTYSHFLGLKLFYKERERS